MGDRRAVRAAARGTGVTTRLRGAAATGATGDFGQLFGSELFLGVAHDVLSFCG